MLEWFSHSRESVGRTYASSSRSSLDYPSQFRVCGTSEEESFTLNAGSDRERKEWMAQIYLATLPRKSVRGPVPVCALVTRHRKRCVAGMETPPNTEATLLTLKNAGLHSKR